MNCSYACHSPEHQISRRQFLAGTAVGSLGLIGFGGMTHPAAAKELEKAQKRVLLIWLHGGASQLETWDPKPGTDTGGPFLAIPTSVPCTHVCELLPHTAKQMHRIALVRGVNTAEDDYGKGAYIIHTGRRKEPAREYPHLISARRWPNCWVRRTTRSLVTSTSPPRVGADSTSRMRPSSVPSLPRLLWRMANRRLTFCARNP